MLRGCMCAVLHALPKKRVGKRGPLRAPKTIFKLRKKKNRKSALPDGYAQVSSFLFSSSSETFELADAEFVSVRGASLAFTSPAAACRPAANHFRPAPGIPTTASCRRSRISHPCAVAANLCAPSLIKGAPSRPCGRAAPGVPSPCLACR